MQILIQLSGITSSRHNRYTLHFVREYEGIRKLLDAIQESDLVAWRIRFQHNWVSVDYALSSITSPRIYFQLHYHSLAQCKF